MDIISSNLWSGNSVSFWSFWASRNNQLPDATYDEPVTGIALDNISLSMIPNSTAILTAIVSPANASNPNVIWTSDNPAVATVNVNGQVSAITVGTAVITVTTENGGFTATCNVSVNAVPVVGISMNSTSAILTPGSSYTLVATITPSNATNKTKTWSSSNPAVASVDPAGIVTALLEGNSIITATSEDGGKTSNCNVIVTTSGNGSGDQYTYDRNSSISTITKQDGGTVTYEHNRNGNQTKRRSQ